MNLTEELKAALRGLSEDDKRHALGKWLFASFIETIQEQEREIGELREENAALTKAMRRLVESRRKEPIEGEGGGT